MTAAAPNQTSPSEPTSAETDRMSDNADDQSMTLWEHLAELRSRIVRMLLAFVAGGAVAWFYRESLLMWLTKPFVDAWGAGVHSGGASLHFPSPASLFIAYVRLAALGGLVFALPFILYQVWAFVAPGLYSREKKFAAPFVVSSCALFALGGWFGWRFAFPVAFKYLLSFAVPVGGLDVKPTVMISDYIEFVTHMLLAFGFAAELPIVVFFLSIAGLVTHKHLIKFFRYFIVIAFVLAAVLTPPDPLSQLMLAVPLCFLYGISIGVAFIFSRRPKEELAQGP
jgi:sec-independent protein translocase protein TatC